jgi:hypothetical protein
MDHALHAALVYADSRREETTYSEVVTAGTWDPVNETFTGRVVSEHSFRILSEDATVQEISSSIIEAGDLLLTIDPEDEPVPFEPDVGDEITFHDRHGEVRTVVAVFDRGRRRIAARRSGAD